LFCDGRRRAVKVVGVVGYRDSGKTTLIRALAQALTAREHQVAVVKHTLHHIDLAGKDTATLLEAAGQVAIISAEASGVFWRKPMSLEDILAYLDVDIVLVEGFKGEKTYPKIACLRGEPDDQDLFDGLVIATVGPDDRVGEVDEIADLVEQKAFKLPNLDCEACGYETCYDMARAIIAGTSSVDDCVSLQPETVVTIDGRPMPLNPFISGIVRHTVLGLLSSLRGFRKGKIEIRL
jgi:molybdopterin-guanine dinucleotide biosynthesis protein B